MKRILYGNLAIDVAADLAEWVSAACTEFANEGRAIAVPLAGYVDGVPMTAQIVVGIGVPLAIVDGDPADPRPDAPNTLAAFAWIRDEVEQLQDEQMESGE